MDGRGVAQGQVQAFGIVEQLDVTKDFAPGFLARFGDAAAEVVKAFGFERGPKTLHQGVIVTVCLATHALIYIILVDKAAKQFTGVLTAAIGVMNLGLGFCQSAFCRAQY